MSGELMTLDAAGFSTFLPGSDVLEAIKANCADGEGFTESHLTKVPTPAGGSTTWEIEELDGVESHKSIDGILVYFGKGGVVWPTTEPKPGTLPVLRTDDCRVAYRVGEDYGDIDPALIERYAIGNGIYDWKAMCEAPNAPFGFGSGKGGYGKRAQEYRVLCVLRKGDAFPLLIRAKPGSLKNINQFINRLTAAGVPYYRAVISLSLEKAVSKGGQAFSRIVPKLIGRLDQESGLRIKSLYTDRLAEAIRNLDVSEISGVDEE